MARFAFRAAFAALLLSALPANAESLYFARRGWHVDVGFAAADIHAPLDRILADFPEARFIFFGFGDQHYLESHHRGPFAMLAALWPGPGLVLVTGLSATPAQAFGGAHVVGLDVSPAGLLSAEAAIWRSLRHQGTDTPERIAHAGPYQGSAYYASQSRYSARHTCNTWAAEVLQAAHLPVHSNGVVFASQVWRQARRLAVGAYDDPAAASAPRRP